MKERMQMLNATADLSLRCQCDLVGVSRSSLYYQPLGEREQNLEIMRLMDEHYLDHPTEGVLRMRRLLRLMGLMAIYPKKNLSKLGLKKYIRPYLFRGFDINRPNQVWAIDITYVPLRRGFLYHTAIIDLYSRYVVGWGVSNTLDASFSLGVLKDAINHHGKPEIINSDQGSQFTCHLWTNFVESSGIKISMDGKGRAIDNAFIERLWRSVKYDYVYIKVPDDGLELYKGLKAYFDYNNHRLCHQGIDNQIPSSLYYSQTA